MNLGFVGCRTNGLSYLWERKKMRYSICPTNGLPDLHVCGGYRGGGGGERLSRWNLGHYIVNL